MVLCDYGAPFRHLVPMTVTYDSTQSPFLQTDLSHWLTYLSRDEAAIIADHDAPQLDGGVEGGGHYPVTEMPACRVLHPVSHKHTSYIELLQ